MKSVRPLRPRVTLPPIPHGILWNTAANLLETPRKPLTRPWDLLKCTKDPLVSLLNPVRLPKTPMRPPKKLLRLPATPVKPLWVIWNHLRPPGTPLKLLWIPQRTPETPVKPPPRVHLKQELVNTEENRKISVLFSPITHGLRNVNFSSNIQSSLALLCIQTIKKEFSLLLHPRAESNFVATTNGEKKLSN